MQRISRTPTTSHDNLAVRYAAPTQMSDASVVVIERFTGPRSAHELILMTKKLVARWDPALRVRLLVDLSDAELGAISLGELVEYVRYVEQIGLHQRAPVVALVAARDSTHNLARLYQTLVSQGERGLGVFTDVEVALAWLREAPTSA